MNRIILRSGALPENFTESDYDDWTDFVAEKINEKTGFHVEVAVDRYDWGRDDEFFGYDHYGRPDDDIAQEMREAVALLWEEFCAQT